MKKAIKNINIILVITIICFFCSGITVQADTIGDNLISNITSGADNFDEMGENKVEEWGITIDDFEITWGIAQIAYFCGTIVALIVTIWLAAKYKSGPDGEAFVKKYLPTYAVLIFLLAAPWVIWQLVGSISSNI